MNNKKKMIMRILMLILAVIMVAGVVFSSFDALAVSAETPENLVAIEDFTTGDLRSAIDSARGSLDQNNIENFEISGNGTLNSTDIQALQMLSNCKTILLEKAKLEDGIFPDYALSGKGSLTKVSLPKGTTRIGSGAFSGCGNLTEITIPNSVTEIGNRAFESCTSLIKITLPDSITSIEECAFRGSGLTEVKLNSKTAPEIGTEVFPKATNIITVEKSKGYEEWTDYNVESMDKEETTASVTEETTAKETTAAETKDPEAEKKPVIKNIEQEQMPLWKFVLTIIVCVFAAIGVSSVLLWCFKKIDAAKKK